MTDDIVDSKDITYDLILDAGDLDDQRAKTADRDLGDHPILTILDMAVKQSGVYLKKQGLEPPNNAVYESFSKPFLNEAAWHYLPDGSLPDDPRIALALGVAGLGLAFVPTLIAVYEKKNEKEKGKEKKEEKEKEKEKEREEVHDTSTTETTATTARPPWMERLESGMLGGI